MSRFDAPAATGVALRGLGARPSAPPVELALRPAPALRLRHLLLLVGVVALGAWLWPRGRAAWRLHQLAVVSADHALCMVGPTGPRLLREDPAALPELLRRRVVAAEASAVVFGACAMLADQLPLEHRALRAHHAAAAEFVEYRAGPGVRAAHSVADLAFSRAPLEALAEQAWPFVRSGFARLVEPSRGALEAAHPSAPGLPGRGAGLPSGRVTYRSTLQSGARGIAAFGSGANARVVLTEDAGVTWRPGSSSSAAELLDRCVVDQEGRAFSLSTTSSGKRVVVSLGPEAAPFAAALGEQEEKLAGVACDETALVALLVGEPDATGHRPARLRLCPFRRACRELSAPPGPGALYFPVDVARVGGDTVVATAHTGVTRVTSSRDDGRSWAPWVLVYDAAGGGGDAAAPFHLLALGDRVLLYGAPAAKGYPLLVSADHGASFRAP
jgi:hypothetical protein